MSDLPAASHMTLANDFGYTLSENSDGVQKQMTLISLVYVSYATRKMSQDDLRAILETSHKNNRAHNITGVPCASSAQAK